jgi:hypothetical protein
VTSIYKFIMGRRCSFCFCSVFVLFMAVARSSADLQSVAYNLARAVREAHHEITISPPPPRVITCVARLPNASGRCYWGALLAVPLRACWLLAAVAHILISHQVHAPFNVQCRRRIIHSLRWL